MATLIQELHRLLKPIPGLRIEYQSDEMLVTLRTDGDRQQTVKVWTEKSRHGDYYLLRLRSRATAARDYKMVYAILHANRGLQLGGLALDNSTNPAAVDVMYNLVGDQVHFNDFLAALRHVAAYADSIEQRTLGADSF